EHVVHWTPLDGRPRILASGIDVLQVHGHVLRVPHRHRAAARRARTDRGAARAAEGGGEIGRKRRAGEGRVALPADDVLVLVLVLVVEIIAIEQEAELAVARGIAPQSAEVRRALAGVGVHVLLVVARHVQAGVVEGIRELDVDRAADVTRGQGEVRGLQRVDLTDVDGAEIREVERLAVARGDLPAFDQHLVERAAEAVDVDALHAAGGRRGARRARVAQAAAVHGDARQARDRLADVAVRELADLLRRHGVDDTERFLLDLQTALQRPTDTRDDDLLQLIGARLRGSARRLRSGGCGILREQTGAIGRQRPGRSELD